MVKRLAVLTLIALSTAAAYAQTGPTQQELNDAASNTRDWLYATHDYSGQRFVDLDRIHSRNASELQPLCVYQMGAADTFQSNSIVYEGILYTTTPTITVALQATNCREIWRHEWEPEGAGIPSQRGLAIKDGLLLRGTTDGHLIALDAATGELVWDREVRAAGSSESVSLPPLVYEDLVIVGPAGTDRGWLQAFDLHTGEPVWRFNTVPAAGEPGYDTWGDSDALEEGRVGGGSVWTVMSLDPQEQVLYVPVGNANPAFYGGDRPGDNLYTNTVLAIDVTTGELLWHYQVEPHGVHNWDLSHAGPLFTVEVDGEDRDLLAAIGKAGILHIVDRDSHEALWQVPVTTIKNVDLPLTAEGVHVCPGYLGGVQWNGPSFHRELELLYVPVVDWCSVFFEDPEARRGGGFEMDPVTQAAGWVTAVDPSTGTVRWRYRADSPMIAAVTATSGNVVFTGSMAGDFLALDARNGEELYRFNTGGAIAGGVVTYEIDGRQYVAVMSGNQSGLWGSRGAPSVFLFGLGEDD